MSSEKRGLKLHSIIEKLSEQCERNSPSHDEEGDDSICTLEISGVKRKQRKRNEVKRVCKEALSQSDYEEESSDIELEFLDETVQGHGYQPDINGSTLQELETGRRVSARLREARKYAKQKHPSSKLINSKKKKEKLKVGVKISKVPVGHYCTGVDSDLAIDVDAFVHHLPILDDIEPSTSSSSSLLCPFCSVMCDDKPNLIQHIKDCHQSDCAIIDSEEDEGSHLESLDNESDEEFIPYKRSSEEDEDSGSDLEEYKPRTRQNNAKNEKSQRKNGAAGEASHSSMDGNSVINTKPDVNDIDDDSNICSAVEWSCRSCHEKLSTEEEHTIHVASCNKKAILKDNIRVRCSCHACGARFEEWKELRDHLSKNSECRKSYQCGKCGQVFSTRGSLKKHLALHSDERPYQCNVCNAAFKDRGYLKRHAVIHSMVKNFKCEFCGKLFAHKRTLREHRMQHTGERPHKCSHCDASFTNSSSLKTHTARHTGIFPFKCEVCSREFAKSYGLKMHSLSHSNEKPFVCEVCGKGFKRSDHLREHRIIHSENKPYKCDTCQKTFNQRVCLRKHLPCREHEKQQRKTRNSLPSRSTTKNKGKVSGTLTSTNQRTMGYESDGQKSQVVDGNFGSKIADSCGAPNDVGVTSSVENSPNDSPLLVEGQTPPSFIRTAPKLIQIDTEYYPEQNAAHDEYPHDDFSSEDLPDRGRSSPISSLLPSAFIPNLSHAMFSIVDPLSLDTLPDAPVLSGRPLNHEHSPDLGSLLRTMDSENLNSIVEQTESFFTHG